MPPRLLHYADVETALDDPDRAGRLAGTLRALDGPDAAVVGAGDVLAPGVLAMVTEGRHALSFLDRVAPAADTFGNHDFDHGLDAARAVVDESPHRWVSANVFAGDERVFDVPPATVVERAGDRVALVGVTDPDTSVPDALRVTDPADAVRAAAATVDADWTVALAHCGAAAARAVARVDAVDAVCAGHVHRVAAERVGGTPVVRPGAGGEAVWEVTLSDGVSTTRHTVADGPLDGPTAERMRGAKAEAGLSEVVARPDEPMARDPAECLAGACPAGALVTDAYRRATGADVAALDTRALRSGSPLSGAVRASDVVGLVPFDAGLHVGRVGGDRLRRLLADAVVTDERAARSDGEVALWLQFSGLSYVVDAGRTEEEEPTSTGAAATVSEVRVGDEPLVPDRDYRLAAPVYVWHSEEFPAVGPGDYDETWGPQYEAVVDHVRERGLSVAVDGRVGFRE